MAVRNAQDHLEVTAAWPASTSAAAWRSHRSVTSRRSHRAAHAASRHERRRWLAVSALSLAIPFVAAGAIVELVR